MLIKLMLALAVLLVVAAIAWTMLLPGVVAGTIRSRTGFEVKIDQLSVNPFTAKVHVGGVVLRNPAGWNEQAFVDLRTFRADAELFPLLGGRLLADEVVVDIAQVTLVRNRDGTLNAIAFKEALFGKSSDTSPAPAEPAAKEAPFFIKRLEMKFDRLVYADHSGTRPVVREYNLGITRELRDVDSVSDLMAPFSGAALAVVTDAVGGMFHGTRQILEGAGGLLKDGGKKAGETLKGFFQQLEKKKP